MKNTLGPGRIGEAGDLHSAMEVDGLAPIPPDELAQNLNPPELRRQLIRGMVAMGVVEGPSARAQANLISASAAAMAVEEPSVDVIRHLVEKEMLMFRFDFYRRSHLRASIESTCRRQGGTVAVTKSLLGFKGLVEDRELAARFRTWGDLPSGTLGREALAYHEKMVLPFRARNKGSRMARCNMIFPMVCPAIRSIRPIRPILKAR